MPERIEIRPVVWIKAEVGGFDSQVKHNLLLSVTSSPRPPRKNGQKVTHVQTRGKTQTTFKARIPPSIREDFREAPGWGMWGVVRRGKWERADLLIAVKISGKWGLGWCDRQKWCLTGLAQD